jgi:tubulin---tyrosine ligase
MPGTRPSSYRPASHRLRPANQQQAGGHKRQAFYSFVSVDDVSTIYNTVAGELWRRTWWREVPPDSIGSRLGGSCYRECDLILAQCHGRGAPFNEIGGPGRVQAINYLQGSKTMTLKAELAMLLREWLEAHPDQEPFTPLTYIVYPRKWNGPRVGNSGGLSLAARRGRLADEREAFLWESQLRDQQGIGNVWVAKTNHGSKGSGVRVVEGGNQTCDFIDAALQGSSQAVAVQKYVEDPLLILGYKFDVRVWVLVDMELGVFVYRQGVLRLSSSPYAPDNLDDTFSHLTNHCIQMKSPEYENLVQGNEMFFDQFRRYLAQSHPDVDLDLDILNQVHKHIVRTVSAAWPLLRRKNRHGGFQLYGYDFMLDSDFRPWLLEVNGAPAAADRLKPALARDIVSLCIDSRFPPPDAAGKGISLGGGGRGGDNGFAGASEHNFLLLVSSSSLDIHDY